MISTLRSLSKTTLTLLILGLTILITFTTVQVLNRARARSVNSLPTETTHYATWYGLKRPVDTTLRQTTGDYQFHNTTNTFNTAFKANPFSSDAIRYNYLGSSLLFSTPEKQPFATLASHDPVVSANTITYPSLAPGLDLRYTIEPTRLLEEFILQNAATAAKLTRLAQQVKLTNISRYETVNGAIFFYQLRFNRERLVFTLPRPVIYELANHSNLTTGISYEIQEISPTSLIITKVINQEGASWLADPTRAYPVAIDLVVDNADSAGNWVSSDPTNTVITQETSLMQEGTGAVKIQTASQTSTTVDLMEYSSDATAQSTYVTNGNPTVTGGSTSTNGGYSIRTFTTVGTTSLNTNAPLDVEYLVVAGGGGGGSAGGRGGGGGGGGVRTGSLSLGSGSYTVTVGGGGAAGFNSNGTNGGNSVFHTITSLGGGGGGSQEPNVPAQNGGSGGGGAANMGPVYSGVVSGGSGTAGQGYNGGNGYYPQYTSGGGGGAGGAGQSGNGSNQPAGGIGLQSSISGSATYYGGGGGGGIYWSGGPAAGGSGGNGGGGAGQGVSTAAVAGTANRGGGGGGNAAAGGSGIVIVRYPTPPHLQSYSESTIKSQGNYALRVVANQTTSLNRTLTRTISSPLNLSNHTSLSFDLRSNRTGSNIKIGLRDSGGTTTELTPNITQADSFQSFTLDLTNVANSNKDAIDQIIITIVNASATNTFYLDNLVAQTTASVNDTVTLTTTSIDLSSNTGLSFWVRSNTGGETLRFEFGETNSTEQTIDFTITAPNTWERNTFDISAIAAASRNGVTKFALRILSNTNGSTIYLDNLTTLTVPAAPTIQSATALSPTSIRWNFTDNSSNESGFKVFDTNNNLVATCSSANLSSCDETGLSINTQYTRKVIAYNDDGNSQYSSTTSLYTHADIPAVPTVTNRTSTTVQVNPNPGNNPSSTTYAIYRETNTTTCDGSGGIYLAANGSSNGSTPVWQTESVWGTVTATGLNDNSSYAFCLKARNGDNIETTWSQIGAHNASYVPLGGDFVCTQDTINTSTFTNRYVDGNNPGRYIIGVDTGSDLGESSANTATFDVKSCLMTINSTDTLAVGKLNLSGGSVAIAQGGEIKIGQPLWVIDADGDGYTSDNKVYLGSKPTNGRRKNVISSLSTQDCADSDNTANTSCFPTATGGTITTSGNYKIHTFTSSGTFQITFAPQAGSTIEYLVVAGGGGGGSSGGRGGGGGGGGVRTGSMNLGVGSYTVTVGSGGNAGSNGRGWNGGNSVFHNITSTGGGGGAGNNYPTMYSAMSGGSGGGGEGVDTWPGYQNNYLGASGTAGQGYAGGNGWFDGQYRAGGGGGAGGAGQSGQSVSYPAGGIGIQSSISGVATYYGGGGGGGIYWVGGGAAGGAGGNGGGGAGQGVSTAAVAGTANRGGGGGGNAAAGGSGIVIVRYLYQ